MRTNPLMLLPLLAVAIAACDQGTPTQSAVPVTGGPLATFATGTSDFEVCSVGAAGSYTVKVGTGPTSAPITVNAGACQVVYTNPATTHGLDSLVTVTYQAQSGVVLDSILKDSANATSNPAVVHHTVTKLVSTNVVTSIVNNDAAARATFYLRSSTPPPPNEGCTLTIGYWKNHAGFGPQADSLSQWLPLWLGTSGGAKSVQVTTAAQAVSILKFSGSPSNPVDKLYAQLLAAELNLARGANPAAISSTISAVSSFLATHNATTSLTNSEKSQVNSWASALDSWNSGSTGPGHCGGDDENENEHESD